MSQTKNSSTQVPGVSDLEKTLLRQRQAFLSEGPPSVKEREERLDQLMLLMLENADAFADAMNLDFGCRAPLQSLATDVFGVLPSIKHTRKKFRHWMKPQKVSGGLVGMSGGKAWIQWQPLGVVGIVSPWNFPLALALQPLAEALAAGNRAMIKVSEFAPRTGELLQSLIAKHFSPDVVTVIIGGAETGEAFSKLAFDHLFFTGAPSIGRYIQRSAADNLVPVTLELGGKCPVVIAPSAVLKKAVAKVAFAKTLNAGQICLSPDYVLVPRGSEKKFVDEFEKAVAKMFPTLLVNEDYCSLISQRHRDRLENIIDDARSKGATVIEVNPAGEDFSQQPYYKMPPTLVLNPSRDMQLMQEELFGPVLPVMSYETIDEVIDQVNSGSRPLATYYFGKHDSDCERYLHRTHSGGAVINDVVLHAMVDELPFGGVGESGMGSYHGYAGFKTFSHPKSIVKAGLLSPNQLMTPPYQKVGPLLQWMIKRERKSVSRRLGKKL